MWWARATDAGDRSGSAGWSRMRARTRPGGAVQGSAASAGRSDSAVSTARISSGLGAASRWAAVARPAAYGSPARRVR